MDNAINKIVQKFACGKFEPWFSGMKHYLNETR